VLALTSGGAFGKDRKGATEQIGNRDVGKGVNFYSIQRELTLGKQMAREVELQANPIRDSTIAEFVSRIGQNLVRNSDARSPFTIKLLDSEDVNAFALPGGFLFVNSGLILKTNSESELAGVMAHEIAHVAARHWTKQATRDDILNLASIPLIFMGGWAGYAIREGMGFAIPLSSLQFARKYEREADFLGLQYLHKTGYDPTSFVDFLERIQSDEKRKPGLLYKLLATHPMTLSRIRAAQSEIQRTLAVKPEYMVNTSGFDEIKNRLMILYDRRKAETDRYYNRPLLRRGSARDGRPADANSSDHHDNQPISRSN
jgi:predicted Zn-dependent protease